MKIKFEQTSDEEVEVIIRGDINNRDVSSLIELLNKHNTNKSKIFVFREQREFILNPEEVIYFETFGNKVVAISKSGQYETNYKLYEVEKFGKPFGFVRISKGVIVNINEILSIEAEFSGNYTALLKDKKTRLNISRKYIKDFRNYVMKF